MGGNVACSSVEAVDYTHADLDLDLRSDRGPFLFKHLLLSSWVCSWSLLVLLKFHAGQGAPEPLVVLPSTQGARLGRCEKPPACFALCNPSLGTKAHILPFNV